MKILEDFTHSGRGCVRTQLVLNSLRPAHYYTMAERSSKVSTELGLSKSIRLGQSVEWNQF